MASECGNRITVSLFGASHGPAVGAVVNGLPAGEPVNTEALQRFLDRRAPGRSALATARKEADIPRFLSGIRDGATTGDPVAVVFENGDAHSGDYEALRFTPRPGHADYTAMLRYGESADLRGGGHFSGRLTAPLCAAGGLALQLLARRGVAVGAHLLRVGEARDAAFDPVCVSPADFAGILKNELPVLDAAAGAAMKQEILAARTAEDSVGGCVECAVTGLPGGVGDPMFDGVESVLAKLLFGIPAVKAVSFGAGEDYAGLRGSQANDAFCVRDGAVRTVTNHCGGILGGITNGMPLLFSVTFKPTPSIGRAQQSVDLRTMKETTIEIKGRHDPCVAVRAVPVVEAAAALAVLDLLAGAGRL